MARRRRTKRELQNERAELRRVHRMELRDGVRYLTNKGRRTIGLRPLKRGSK